jgi:adenylate cyclase
MAEERVQRRLAAILAADVVGYSRLMRADEAGTLAQLNAIRKELLDPKIAEYGGRIVKTTGDGILIEFPSAVDAVQHAVNVQQAMAERNATVADDRRMEIRMGINVGDVIVEDDDLFGDGVNVAARLEGLAEPGGICVSGSAHEQVRHKLDLAFEDLGDQSVKNIDEPVRVYAVGAAGSDQAKKTTADGQERLSTDKPSIAVLPFNNMSGDPEQEFFTDGLAEDIITTLSKIERMRVIARHSTFEYKGQPLDLRRIAEELGVRYVLEGSVRRGGDRLRITAQLIDAADGSHLWAERFDRSVDDLFDIQDEITKEIVTALRVKLTDGEEARVWARGTNNIDAWQYAIRAMELFMSFTSSNYLEARELAEKATQLDPDYAHAWATLGFTYWWDGRLGYTGDTEAKFARADELAKHAMALDDGVSWCLGLSAMVAAPLGRHDEGIAVARRGVEFYPGNADVRAFLAFALLHAGHYREAEEHFRAAMALNPFYPLWYRNGLARTLICLDELEEALAISNELLEIEPAFFQALLQRAYIFRQTGREAEAREAIAEVRRLAPNYRARDVPGIWLVNDAAVIKRITDGLRAAGLPE